MTLEVRQWDAIETHPELLCDDPTHDDRNGPCWHYVAPALGSSAPVGTRAHRDSSCMGECARSGSRSPRLDRLRIRSLVPAFATDRWLIQHCLSRSRRRARRCTQSRTTPLMQRPCHFLATHANENSPRCPHPVSQWRRRRDGMKLRPPVGNLGRIPERPWSGNVHRQRVSSPAERAAACWLPVTRHLRGCSSAGPIGISAGASRAHPRRRRPPRFGLRGIQRRGRSLSVLDVRTSTD